MPNDEIDYEAIRKRAEKRVKDRIDFFQHLAIFVVVNAFLWALGAITGSLGFPWPLLVTLPWGMGLVIHAITVFAESGAMDRMRENAIRHEIEAEKRRLGMIDEAADTGDDEFLQKPKRGRNERAMRLGDDGELIESEPDEVRANRASKS